MVENRQATPESRRRRARFYVLISATEHGDARVRLRRLSLGPTAHLAARCAAYFVQRLCALCMAEPPVPFYVQWVVGRIGGPTS